MKKKIKVGIDIDEILRAKWIQFDKYYVEEFGEEGVPENDPYVFDYYSTYKWEDSVESTKILKEELPENINPLDYVVDEKSNEAPADAFLFNKEEKKITAREKFNRFMYEDYVFEIFASASPMYRNMNVDIEKFYKKYSDKVDFILFSKENWFSIPPTLYFLNKVMSRFKKYIFVDDKKEVWNYVNTFITTDPEFLKSKKPRRKKIIKLERPYNIDSPKGDNKGKILHINDLIDNDEFEKIIKYK